MNKKIHWFFCLAVVIGAGQGLAQQYVSQDGHALDANMRVGSLGWNSRVRLDPLVPRINLMITGNVRGGQSFQGLVPYQSVGELQTGVGVDTLSNFRRDSIGMRDVSASRPFQVAAPYVAASRQVTHDFGNRIDNTYNATQQWSQPTQSTRRLSQQDQFRALRPITRLNNSLNVLSPSPIANPLAYTQALRRPAWTSQLAARKEVLPAQPSAFSDTFRQENRENAPQNHNEQVFELLESQNTAQFDKKLPVLPTEKEFSAVEGEINEQVPQSEAEITDELEQQQAAETRDLYRGQSGLINANVTGKIAAINQKQYQSYMTQGNTLMAQGRFYNAADSFGSALFFSPKNVSAVIAKSHALFAAGEFMSSAFYLDQAIELSKEVSQAPVDMEALLGDTQVLGQRMDDLKNWQERTGNPMLLFLQGYAQLKMGNAEEAKASLDKALALQPEMASIKVLLAGLGESQ